jgi:hypothetical protein
MYYASCAAKTKRIHASSCIRFGFGFGFGAQARASMPEVEQRMEQLPDAR